MTSIANWRASFAACALTFLIMPLPAAAADLGGYAAPGTSYYAPSERRPLDGSYRDGYGPTDWNGLYFGAGAGWGGGQSETSGAINRAVDVSGFLGGVHAGYNFQSGALVTGLEVDGDWSGADGSSVLTGGNRLDVSASWLSSLRLRLGYATGRYLFYGTAGGALAGLDMTLTGPGADSALSQTMTGYAVGLGVEAALTQSVSARIEALHYGFGEETFNTNRGAVDADLSLTTVRAGLSIKLN